MSRHWASHLWYRRLNCVIRRRRRHRRQQHKQSRPILSRDVHAVDHG
jgi:hypothetical protein